MGYRVSSGRARVDEDRVVEEDPGSEGEADGPVLPRLFFPFVFSLSFVLFLCLFFSFLCSAVSG